jgi:hypothetical protein
VRLGILAFGRPAADLLKESLNFCFLKRLNRAVRVKGGHEFAIPRPVLRIFLSESLIAPIVGSADGRFGTAGNGQAVQPTGRQCAVHRVSLRERRVVLSTGGHDRLCAETAQVSVDLEQPIGTR